MSAVRAPNRTAPARGAVRETSGALRHAGGRLRARIRFSRPCHGSPLPGPNERTTTVLLGLAGTGYGLIGILVIILLVVLILYFIRRV
jgi:hypothetical protein